MGVLRGQLSGGAYRPPLIHRLLSPRVSGNTINGLGESEPRRPTRIYHWCYLTRAIWYPHYLVNLLLLIKARIFYRKFYRVADEGLDEQRRELRDVAPPRRERSPQAWTDEKKSSHDRRVPIWSESYAQTRSGSLTDAAMCPDVG